MSTENKTFTLKKIFITLVLLVVFIGLAAAAGYFFWQYRKLSQNNPEAEVKAVVSAVSKHMQLPDETPSIATVTDKEKLKEQGFFKNAENGDKVLIYIQSQRAILYRPSLKKIIDVAPVKTTESPEPPSNTPTPSASPTTQTQDEKKRVAVFNGTKTAGLASRVEQIITSQGLAFQVTTKQNASVETYTETLVVDLSGQNKTAAEQLAQAISAKVQPLPTGETKPNADLLVILGSDFE